MNISKYLALNLVKVMILLGFVLTSALGFSQDDIRSLLGVEDNTPSCDEILSITTHHRKAIKAKISDLRKLERRLSEISSTCLSNDTPDCPLIESLSEIH